jgi:glycosyltransferase involved in cell wall biosynthesis
MKVMLLSDVQRKGGAGIAAHRLAVALKDHGHEILWATPHPDADCGFQTINCREFSAPGRAARRIALTLRPGQRRAVDAQAITRRIFEVVRQHRPGVVHVHNLHGADLPATLPAELSRRVPVVWTLHDMWAFTGSCAYSMGCRGFESACDTACPMAGTYPVSPPAQVPLQFEQRKQALHRAGRIAFATPSRWLAEQGLRGMLAGHDVRVIHNCVELDRYKPIERASARRALDLPMGRPVLVSAATPEDPRKGAAVLYEALTRLGRPNTILLQLGGSMPKDLPGRWDHRVLSDIRDPRLMRLAYSAGDAHVLPTLADNLPNTLLEAAACGVPSIGSGVGGVAEAMVDGQTGWLVAPGDAEALAARIAHVIDQPQGEAEPCRRACRVFAESRFSPANQARSYAELFTDTIRQKAGRAGVIGSTGDSAREAA